MSKIVEITDKRFNPKLEIAFYDNGSMAEYDYYKTKLQPNFAFEDLLIYEGYSRGRSSAVLNFTSLNDQKKYSMFLSEFDDFMKESGFEQRKIISGIFCFCKKGSNYSLRWLKNAG
jgi:hypothetical protein